MQTEKDKLGKVSITVEKDYWNINKDYDKLTVVEKEGTFSTFLSRKPVPAGTFLNNRTYWIPFSSLKEKKGNEEDINFNDKDELQFSDREYNEDNPNGMGYVILRKDKSFEEQIAGNSNTIFEIRYYFDLDGEDVTVPENCILDFKGGKLLNGSLIFNNTLIKGEFNNFYNVELNGTYNINKFSLFVDNFGADPTGVNDSSVAINKAIQYCYDNKLNIPIEFTKEGVYLIKESAITLKSNIYLKGNGASLVVPIISAESNVDIGIFVNEGTLGSEDVNIKIDDFILDGNGIIHYSDAGEVPRGCIALVNVKGLEISRIIVDYDKRNQPIWLVDCSNVKIHNCFLRRNVTQSGKDTSGIWIYAVNRKCENFEIYDNNITSRNDECLCFGRYGEDGSFENIEIYNNNFIAFGTRGITFPTILEGTTSKYWARNINIHNNYIEGGHIYLENAKEYIKISNNRYFTNSESPSHEFVLTEQSGTQSTFLHDLEISDNTVNLNDSVSAFNLICANNIFIKNNTINKSSSIADSCSIIAYQINGLVIENNSFPNRDVFMICGYLSNTNINNNIIRSKNIIKQKYVPGSQVNILESLYMQCNMLYNTINIFTSQNDAAFNTVGFINNIINTGQGFKEFNSSINYTLNNIFIFDKNTINYSEQINVPIVYKGKNKYVYNSLIVYYENGYRCNGNENQKPYNPPAGFVYTQIDVGPKQLIYNGSIWVDTNGIPPYNHKGIFANKPTASTIQELANLIGFQYFATDKGTYGLQLYGAVDGNNQLIWIDGAGNVVS